MYGIVNKAIQELILTKYGEETWAEIKKRSDVTNDFFLSNEPYPDETTYKLAISASEVLNTSLDNVLIVFGEFWVLETGKKSYGSLIETGGKSAREFILNLPGFHSRVMLIYPNLQPPEFKIEKESDHNLIVSYFSHRQGLTHFVYGLFSGIGKLFEDNLIIEILSSEFNDGQRDKFRISFSNEPIP